MAKEPHSFSLLPRVPLCGELRNEAPLKQGVAVCSMASQSPPSGSLPEALGFYLLHTGVPPEWRGRGRACRARGLTITVNLSQKEEDSRPPSASAGGLRKEGTPARSSVLGGGAEEGERGAEWPQGSSARELPGGGLAAPDSSLPPTRPESPRSYKNVEKAKRKV